MPVPKGKRNTSREEFDAIHHRIHDEALDMIEHNFRTKRELTESEKRYIQYIGKELMNLVFSLVYHIKVANALVPTAYEELMERRINQDKAIGVCFDILTLYELALHRLRVQEDYGTQEIRTLRHQINAIKAWRTSDNKRYKNLKPIDTRVKS